MLFWMFGSEIFFDKERETKTDDSPEFSGYKENIYKTKCMGQGAVWHEMKKGVDEQIDEIIFHWFR